MSQVFLVLYCNIQCFIPRIHFHHPLSAFIVWYVHSLLFTFLLLKKEARGSYIGFMLSAQAILGVTFSDLKDVNVHSSI